MVDSQCFCVMYILSDTVCIVPLAVGGAQFIFTENARGLGNRTKSPFPLHISLPGMNLSAKLSNQASVSESYLYTLRDLDQPTFFSVFLLNDSLTFIIENESPIAVRACCFIVVYLYSCIGNKPGKPNRQRQRTVDNTPISDISEWWKLKLILVRHFFLN